MPLPRPSTVGLVRIAASSPLNLSVSFHHHSRRRDLQASLATMTAIAALLLPPRMASAEPLGGTVVGGSAGISQAGSVTNINQSSNKAIINWQNFSVAPQETVNFNQPSSASVTLNRVIGNETSVISGVLNANGQVFIVNSAGVLFGKGAQVNVGGLVASTRDISNADFMAGNYTFSGSSSAAVVNQGRIRAAQGGYVALLGKTVSNDGVISARLGTVAMSAGDKITLNFGGNSLLDVTIDQGTLNGLVENKRAIRANGGQVIMTAKAADAVLSAQVNNSGIVQARAVSALKGGAVNSSTARAGKIKLLADGGTTRVSGKLDASAPKGGNGGTIETSGNKVAIADSAVITTLAANGRGGTWLIDPDGYTIAASGGDITGAALSSRLATNGSVVIHSTDGHGADGNINVNDAVSWSANTLTLWATNNIYVNAVMTAAGSGSFTGHYGSGTNADGTPMGMYMAQGKNADGTNNGIFTGRLDFSGSGTLILNGDLYRVIQSLDDLYRITTDDSIRNYNSDPFSNQTLVGFYIADGHYALGSNFDATGFNTAQNYANPPPPPGPDFLPSPGYAVVPGLSGVLEGLGHTVSNLNLNGSTNSFNGLVADNFGGTIRNIGMVGTIVNGSRFSGTLVGINEGSIVNAFATGGVVISAGQIVGGLVGGNEGLIANSWADLFVAGAGQVGGLAGYNKMATIINSYATGSVNGYRTGSSARLGGFGGLVGSNTDGLIRNSYAKGEVLSPTNSNGTTILNSSQGVGDLVWVGGLVGYSNSDGFGTVAMISNSYATGNVWSAGQFVGGLVGQNSGGNIDHSYATGNVTSTYNGTAYVGGLVGGTSPYSGLGGQVSDSHATGNVTAPNASFVGGLAGNNGGTITGSYYSSGQVQGGSNVGGLVGNNAGIIESSYSTADIAGGNIVGGLVGSNQNTISNSHSTSNVNGVTVVGGVAGYNGTGAIIRNSSASGNVNGTTNVGGITGWNEKNTGRGLATITGSSFTGAVTGVTNVGGIAGTNVGNVLNSFSSGDVFGSTNVGALVGANGGLIDGSRSIGEVNGAPGSLAGSNSVTTLDSQTLQGTTRNSTYQDVKAEARERAAAEAAARAAAEAAARAAAAQAAARAAAAAQRANAAVRTANASTANASTSAVAALDAGMSSAGTSAASSPSSSKLNSEFKSLDDKVRADDDRERRRVAASAASRSTRRAGSGQGGGLGATIRSIDIDGQRFDLQNNKKDTGP